jgi:hypothetical protein
MNPNRRNQRVAIVAWGVAVLVGLTVNAGIAGAAASQGLLAQTKISLTDANRYCGGAFISAPTKAFGSATMNETRAPAGGTSPNLSAGLTIQGATAGATYGIRLIQVDNNGNAVGDSCQTLVGTLTVDALGNGTASVGGRVVPGAARWWVDLNNQANFADYLDTDLVAIV